MKTTNCSVEALSAHPESQASKRPVFSRSTGVSFLRGQIMLTTRTLITSARRPITGGSRSQVSSEPTRGRWIHASPRTSSSCRMVGVGPRVGVALEGIRPVVDGDHPVDHRPNRRVQVGDDVADLVARGLSGNHQVAAAQRRLHRCPGDDHIGRAAAGDGRRERSTTRRPSTRRASPSRDLSAKGCVPSCPPAGGETLPCRRAGSRRLIRRQAPALLLGGHDAQVQGR